MCYAGLPDFGVCRHGAISKALQAVTKLLRVATESLRSRYEPLPSRYESLVIMERDGSKELASQRQSLRSQPSSEGCGLGDVPSAPLPQGDSLWLAPSANVCGRLQGREARRGATSWGHYSTTVRILQEGGGGASWAAGLVMAYALLRRRSGLACAAIPPAPPSDVFQNRGTPPYPRRGLRPLHPARGTEEAPFSHLARRDAC